MVGNLVFPVISVLVAFSVQLSIAQPPPRFFLGGPRTSPRSWGVPNEIFGGGGPAFGRPPQGVLVAGHGPPGSRPLGPVRHGGRPPFPLLLTSTPIPAPSDWPIQRARDTGHFEYEVMPRLAKPPTLMQAGPPRGPPNPYPTEMITTTTLSPPEMVRVLPQDAFVTSSPRPQSRTDGHPPPFMVTNHPPGGHPTYATPSDADFQEGFRVLKDLFREDAGSDIRSNLVGGSDVSFSGGYFPPLNGPSGNNSIGQKQQEEPLVQITPAKEQGILIAGTPPKNEDSSSSEEDRATPTRAGDQVKQATDISYGPPQYQNGPAQHSSFMFSDPEEPSGTYKLYSNGFEGGPPPPFHIVGNSIIPPPLPPPRQSTNPQSQDGRRPPSPSSPQSSPLSPTSQQPQGAYNAHPQGYRSVGGRGTPPSPIPMPMMMMPLAPEQTGNGPVPSPDEVQRALGILARYANKQAHKLGMSATPQMMMQMLRQAPPNQNYGPPPQQNPPSSSPPSSSYGAPPQQQQNQAPPTPSSTYGTPPQQQTTQGSPSVEQTRPVPPSGLSNSFENSFGGYTTEPADVVTVSSPEESSPFPTYGPPQIIQIGGGYETSNNNGGYETSSSSGWSSGGGWGSVRGTVDLIGAKVNALKTLGTAVTGGIQQVGALKAGILNAGLNVLGGLGHAKGKFANSLKIPIMSKQPKPVYGAPSTTSTSTSSPQYGPPQPQPEYGATQNSYSMGGSGWGSSGGDGSPGPIAAIANAAKAVVGGITNTIAASAKAGVGIGVSKNDFLKNHFVIKGQAFTDVVSKKIANKNEYFQNVLRHVTSIFEAARKKPDGGWSRR